MMEWKRLRGLLRCLVLIAVVYPGYVHQASGQSEFGAALLFGLPRGEFHDRLDSHGTGFSFRYGRNIGQTPVSVGVDLGYLLYGSEKWKEVLLSDVPDVTVDVHTTNNILLLHLYVRAEPRHGRVRPFAEGMFGGSYLFTNTSLENSSTGEAFASSLNLSDWASSFGFGGGVRYFLIDGVEQEGVRVPFQLVLEGRLTYLRGASARYLKKGSITRGDGMVSYDILESRTDMLLPQVGLAFRF